METKGALQSKTIIGIILAALGTFLEFAPQLLDALPPEYTPWIQKGVVFAGLALALYGKITSTTQIQGLVGKKNESGKASPAVLLALALALMLAVGCSTVCNEKNVKAGLAAANNTFAVVANATASAIETGALDGDAEEKTVKILATVHDYLESAERFEALGMVEEACQSIQTATGALKKAVK